MALTTASAVLYGVTPLVASLIYGLGGDPVTLTFYRNLLVVPPLLVLMAARKISFRITRKELGLLLLMGVGFRVSTTLMLYQAYTLIPTGTATTLHFLYPLFTALLCRVLFREKLGPRKRAALVLAVGGVGAFLWGSGGGSLPGMLLSVCSGLTYACYMTGMDKTALRDMHPTKVACYMGLLNALAMLPVGLPTHQLHFAQSAPALALTVLLALSTSFGAVALLQSGIQRLGASSAAIFSMFEPITSVLAGLLLLHEPLHPASLLGCALILGGMSLIALPARRKARQES